MARYVCERRIRLGVHPPGRETVTQLLAEHLGLAHRGF